MSYTETLIGKATFECLMVTLVNSKVTFIKQVGYTDSCISKQTIIWKPIILHFRGQT